jgi:hypothetical protein
MNEGLSAVQDARWTAMRTFLDRTVGELNYSVDNGNVSVPLLAGLALARDWLTELMPGDNWEQFCHRLHQATTVLAAAPDAGSVTQFGLWDGLKAAENEAARANARTA